MIHPRLTAALLSLGLLTACGGQKLEEKPVPLGDFKLGLNVIVTDKMQKVPISREASAEEWTAAMSKAIADRFGRFDGNKFFNIGVSVDAYALAPPGIPLVASPRSVLVVNVSVFDDAAGEKLDKDGQRFTVFESVDGKTMLGSGLTKSKSQQMQTLAFNAAKQIEDWMRTHPEWFGTYSGSDAPQGAETQPADAGAATVPPGNAGTVPRPVRRPDAGTAPRPALPAAPSDAAPSVSTTALPLGN